MSIILAADTGGTFTDLAAFDLQIGRVYYTKSLTTYENLVAGVMDCVRKANVHLSDAEVVKLGTTLVINTFVQRNGARTALVTTKGHRDILELRRGNRTRPFDLRYERDPILIERDFRFEVEERIGGDGEILKPLDLYQLSEIAMRLRSLGIEAVAVSFLNSYVNAAHEREAAAYLRSALPDMYVTAGTELTREWYEYERTSTAAANAYVGPRLNDYLLRLEQELRRQQFGRSFYLMASNGGVFSVDRAREQPVMLVESGPVGGCIGASVYACEAKRNKIIAFDMGGTTAKCALIENGAFDIKSPYYVGGTEYGFPIRGAVLDIVEVGAGGGSIAWIEPQGRLRVGPKSAGSSPGPVAYGRGGTQPTITDANLALGRIAAASFLGGEMQLDEAAALDAISGIAEELHYHGEQGLDQAAQGILALGTATMVGAIKQVTVERGQDPREFALFAFGGGGPLHAATLARELGIPEVIIPPEPGVFSAIGMLLADARTDDTRTFLRPLTPAAVDEMLEVFNGIERETHLSLSREVSGSDIWFERQVHMRFRGQRHSIRTLIGEACNIDRLRSAFEAQYRQRYGFVEPGAPLELVSLVSTAFAGVGRPKLEQLRPQTVGEANAAARARQVYFGERRSRVATPVLLRQNLPAGYAMNGPAIIEEYGSTTVVGPDDRFEIGSLGEIRIFIG